MACRISPTFGTLEESELLLVLVLCVGLRKGGGREEVTRHGREANGRVSHLTVMLSIEYVAYIISVDRPISPMGQEILTPSLQGKNLKPREVR